MSKRVYHCVKTCFIRLQTPITTANEALANRWRMSNLFELCLYINGRNGLHNPINTEHRTPLDGWQRFISCWSIQQVWTDSRTRLALVVSNPSWHALFMFKRYNTYVQTCFYVLGFMFFSTCFETVWVFYPSWWFLQDSVGVLVGGIPTPLKNN